MKNRVGLPDLIRNASFSLRNDETRVFRSGALLTVAWRAATKRKPLIMLSSNCTHDMVTVSSRRATQLWWTDQFTVYYSFVCKSVNWWRKVFFWLMEVAVVNSYILYKSTTAHPSTHREYRLSLICTLASELVQTAPARGPGRRRASHRQAGMGDPDRLNSQPHFLDRDGGGPRDVVCSHQSRGQRHRTSFFCKSCRSHPPLCHTLDNYRV